MARYPLEPLLSARRFREEEAMRALALARTRLEDALREEKEAAERLEDWRRRRPLEETRLFEEIRGTLLSQDQLDDHRLDVQALKQRELDFEEALCQAGQEVSVRREAEEQARQALADAVRGKQKIEKHKDVWSRVEAARIAAAEEAELEDHPYHAGEDADAGMEEMDHYSVGSL